MKRYLLFLICCMCTSAVFTQNNQWAWMGGENNYTPAAYGIKSVADSANRPGIRSGAASWTDASGNFWLLGGNGVTEHTSGGLNDLWKYDPSTKWWTWVNGDSVAGQKAVYGTRGSAAPANKPGAFSSAVSWTDASGNFWMYTNVLWKYVPSANRWTWVNGDTAVTKAVYGTKGVAGAANKPGPTNSVEWSDTSGNFWLYGDVLWKYNVATDLWTWVHGDTVNTTTVYGLKGVPNSSNTPGTRKEVTGWSDTSGKFWLFGGYGTVNTPFLYRINYYTGNLNDLWNYDPATNLWTWVGGDTILYAGGTTGTIGTAAPGNRPSARSNAVSWKDSSGNLWLFGGYRYTPFALPYYQPYNDVWKFDRANNLWTCYNNSSPYFSQDSFSVKGVESPYTKPAARYGAIGWPDASGGVWIFGGTTVDVTQNIQSFLLNDLLRYNPKTNLWSLKRENKDGREYGVYGTRGVADAANLPGGRYDAMSSTDSAGNLWLFGGEGYSSAGAYYKLLNDLWKRDTAGIWTWESGLTTAVPSARIGAACWTDANDQLWLFGGNAEPMFTIYNNELWRFDKNTNQWTQVSGNSAGVYGIKGRPDAANKPPARYNAVSWSDNTGKLYLFGGDGNFNNTVPTELNDLWSYDPAISQWTWMSGDSVKGLAGVYGIKGVPDAANRPGARQGMVSWADASGNVWIFGGFISRAKNYYNDLWMYNTATRLWTWMSGDSAVNKNGVYGMMGKPDAANKPGSRYEAVSWIDASGKLWLFGGAPAGGAGSVGTSGLLLNDLWNYDPATNLWTWISGDSSINKNAIAGSPGMANTVNKPGSRLGAAGWKDKSGNLWLIGGTGYGVKGGGILNDLWKLSPASPALPVNFISFTASAKNNGVALNWQTGEEQQCAYYAIQRSRDGIGFDSIGTVTATGNEHTVNNYTFIDGDPFSDVNYYRIRQVDKDGKFTYSVVRKVMIQTAGFTYTIAQNPVTDQLKVYMQSAQPVQLQLEVRDAAGHLLIRQQQQMAGGRTTYVIAARQLAAGIYMLTVHSGKASVTKKFIKQ